jgi:hypothetical protein
MCKAPPPSQPIPGWVALGSEQRPWRNKYGNSGKYGGSGAASIRFDAPLRPPREAFSFNKLPHYCLLTVMLAGQHR